MTEIHAIDKQSVHQICSGQVIFNLATAIKELVENSLDAGATSVEIKLKEYGLNLVEVVDNGTGVEEHNFEGLTLKHHTSKLRVFSDLTSVETFGFRGEALSSLCAVCKLTITTKHKSARVGHKLEFNNNGEIIKKTCVARQPGTSVTLTDLFVTLPVRYKEFKKNIKKEYTKLLVLLNGYCLISTGVRISCTNETGKGNRSTVLSTTGVSSVRDNISTIFGSKHCSTLLPFKQIPPSEEVCETYSLKLEDAQIANELCTISGFVSSCGPGLGRTSNDRQFLSINKRPCDMPKLSKVVNEVYHMFNRESMFSDFSFSASLYSVTSTVRYQYPFVQLELSTNRRDVDVNVTPDKRKIFLQHEKLLLAIVKSSLLAMYNEGGHAIGGLVKQSQNARPLKNENVGVQGSLKRFITQSSPSFQAKTDKPTTSNVVPETKSDKKMEQMTFLSQFRNAASPVSSHCTPTSGRKRFAHSDTESAGFKQRKLDPVIVSKHEDAIAITRKEHSDTKFELKIISKGECEGEQNCKEEGDKSLAGEKAETITDAPCREDKRPFRTVEISLAVLKKTLRGHDFLSKTESNGSLCRNFRAKISSDQNQQAEAELSKYFTKESFSNMNIIGQFNLGFIIAQHDDDLFIIDQHASDEKYNFEMLQKTTELHGQKLIMPQKLELTAGDRLVMQENSRIFERNGFGFSVAVDIDTNQEDIFLTRVPSSKNRTFDHTDVAELIFMLTDAPGVLCRPSRVRQMFASRACRKSIMVGTALNKHEMCRIVNHMAELNQPWNCPHGRPTMRHIINLSMVSK